MSGNGGAPLGKGEASTGSGSNSNNRGSGRRNTQQLISTRDDLVPAAITLVFLLLGLLRASFQRCYCV